MGFDYLHFLVCDSCHKKSRLWTFEEYNSLRAEIIYIDQNSLIFFNLNSICVLKSLTKYYYKTETSLIMIIK